MSVRLSFLVPGRADEFVRAANGHGAKWLGIAKKIQYSRTAIYVGVALTAISAVGLAFATAPLFFAFAGTACLGLLINAVAAKKFHSATALVIASYSQPQLAPPLLPSISEICEDLLWSDNDNGF